MELCSAHETRVNSDRVCRLESAPSPIRNTKRGYPDQRVAHTRDPSISAEEALQAGQADSYVPGICKIVPDIKKDFQERGARVHNTDTCLPVCHAHVGQEAQAILAGKDAEVKERCL